VGLAVHDNEISGSRMSIRQSLVALNPLGATIGGGGGSVEVVVEPIGNVPPRVVVGIEGVEPGATTVVEPVLPSVPPPDG
jgi:hypothetical protein